jgi:hypothetical protein
MRSKLSRAKARLQEFGKKKNALLSTARTVAHQVPDIKETLTHLIAIAPLATLA